METRNSTGTLRRLRQVVTPAAVGLAIAHLIWPDLGIDAITIGLLLIAVLPWVTPLVKSFELPGGVKVELQDMQAVTDRVEDAGLLAEHADYPEVKYSFQLVADHDPNLALAGLRIEIEHRLVKLAEKHDVHVRSQSVGRLLRALDQRGILTHEQHSALSDLTGLLNSAVHGAVVDSDASAWAMRIAPHLLQSLDRLISQDGPKVFVQPDEPKFPRKGDIWMKDG